jgi:hypothetical protein
MIRASSFIMVATLWSDNGVGMEMSRYDQESVSSWALTLDKTVVVRRQAAAWR